MKHEALSLLSHLTIQQIKDEFLCLKEGPYLIELSVSAVLTLLKFKDPDWEECSRVLEDHDLLIRMRLFNFDNIDDATYVRIERYLSNPDFDPKKV